MDSKYLILRKIYKDNKPFYEVVGQSDQVDVVVSSYLTKLGREIEAQKMSEELCVVKRIDWDIKEK